jgi:hypothetical protein
MFYYKHYRSDAFRGNTPRVPPLSQYPYSCADATQSSASITEAPFSSRMSTRRWYPLQPAILKRRQSIAALLAKPSSIRVGDRIFVASEAFIQATVMECRGYDIAGLHERSGLHNFHTKRIAADSVLHQMCLQYLYPNTIRHGNCCPRPSSVN